MDKEFGTRGALLEIVAGAALIGALLGGCTEENADYCGPGNACPAGLRCDPTLNRCVPKDGGAADGARQRDGGGGGDDGGGGGDVGTDKALGAPCGGAGECGSGFCSDGVCCEATCDGRCRSCALPGSAGRCALVPSGTDPDGDCKGDGPPCGGSCDGAGGCTFAAADEPCQAPSCAAGELSSGRCDGAGACAETRASCGGYTCADASSCRSACTAAATDCSPGFECVGGSCANPQPDGSPCATNPKACLSNQCVDGVCCAAASCPVCQACNLNGQGSCSAVTNGTSCGAVSCSAAQKAVPACQAGACQPQTLSCDGYQCNDAGSDCRAACETHEHCVSATHFCNGSKQCQPRKALGEACGAAVECANGQCTDGVCCGVADCPHCQLCQLGSGACGPGPDGPSLPGECPGDAICGAGVCAAGACAYQPLGTQCAESCAGHQHTVSACDAAHLCTAGAAADCSPYLCDAAGVACRTACVSSAHCVSASVCNRLNAHLGNAGTCIDPTRVVTVTSSSSVVDLQSFANTAPGSGKDHLKLVVTGSLGFTGFSLSAGNLIVVGEPYGSPLAPKKPTIGWPSGDVPAVHASAAASIYLQGVKLTSAAIGGSCSTGATLAIIDSEIGPLGEWGVLANDCNVTLRRNTIKDNWGGVKAIDLSGNRWLLATDNLIADNGTYTWGAGTCVISDGGGGLWVDGMAATLINNTITNNVAKKGGTVASGVHCTALRAGSQLTNLIVQNNHCTAAETVGCTFSNSNVPDIATANGNNPSPCLDANYKAIAPCIDTGANVSTITQLDLANSPRPKGAGTDRGAYEVQ